MKYHREGLLLPEPEVPAEDTDLKQSLDEVIGDYKSVYDKMNPSSERQQEITIAWHEGKDASLLVEGLDPAMLGVRQLLLKQWKADLIQRTDIDPDVKQLYRWRVNEYIANINMLIASSNGDMRRFAAWNKFIYGEPDEHIYRGALDWVANDAEAILADETQPRTVIDAAQRVLDSLDGKRGYRELLSPDSTVFENVRSDHMKPSGYYGLLLAGVDIPQGKVTTVDGDRILEQVLRNIQSAKDIRDASGSSWSVTSDAVWRPAKLNMPAKRFIGLGTGHEVGSHELEKVNGARGPIGLASDGLDRYELGNEGRAVTREQVVYNTFDEFGKLVRWRDILRRHIAISFACGVGEKEPQNSAAVYKLVNDIDYMYAIKLAPNDPVEALESARKKTDSLLLRVLKGTDGQGGAYLKDKVYLEGNVAAWLRSAEEGPSSISNGDLGKFDINNERHLAILRRFGLLPSSDYGEPN